ncbi:MAG: Asp-tRNA(Asn)/Glu-tRNA(Gln) amidotransferase subunit GatA [Vicinamibacterales bacterium]
MTAAWTAREIRDRVADGSVSAEAVCAAALERIATHDVRLHAFLSVDTARAMDSARTVDARRQRGEVGLLAGVPIAIKDNICTAGTKTTAGSRILEHFVSPYDATVIERLRAAGAVIVGKTNCDEFAMGSSNENSAFGPAHNPWRLDCAPGGSSGGSAIAVAARLTPLALGSDTGGSVRQPAAFCGVVGLKPTYGRVSRYGLIAFGSSLDQIGPFARTVDDTARLLGVIAGVDGSDSTCAAEPVPDYAANLAGAGLQGIRLGVPRRFLDEGVDGAVLRAFDEALAVFRDAGAELVDVELPHARYAIPVYYLVATAEASSNLARYDGVRYTTRATLPPDGGLDAMYDRTRELGFGAEVKRRILLGTYVLSAGYYDAFYLKAQQVRTLIRQDYERALSDTAAILMPTSPVPPFKLGERCADPLQMYLADVFTVSANLAGLPAMSVPCGFTPDRLPVGLQLVGHTWEESALLTIGHAFQQRTTWHDQAPPGF